MNNATLYNMSARELCGVDDTTALEVALQIKLEAALDIIEAMQTSVAVLADMGDEL